MFWLKLMTLWTSFCSHLAMPYSPSCQGRGRDCTALFESSEPVIATKLDQTVLFLTGGMGVLFWMWKAHSVYCGTKERVYLCISHISIFVWPLRYHPWNDKHRKILRAYGPAPPPPDPFYEEIKARHGVLRSWTFEPTLNLWVLETWRDEINTLHIFAHPPGRDPWSLPGRLRQHQDAAACQDRPFAARCNAQLQSFSNI